MAVGLLVPFADLVDLGFTSIVCGSDRWQCWRVQRAACAFRSHQVAIGR
jgi:hypothetical protein